MVERRRQRTIVSPVTEQVETKDRTSIIESEDFVGPDPSKVTPDRLIPSGATLVNCGCSDTPFGAFAMGSIVTNPGKSASGKSVSLLTMAACCAVDERFDDYDIILDDAEQTTIGKGSGFNLAYLFPPLAPKNPNDLTSGRLIPPNWDKRTKDPIPSETIQNFKYNILKRCDSGKPFIYILDSLDSLSSDEELEREYKAMRKAAIDSKDADMLSKVDGSYKAEKAKHIGEVLRMINGRIKHADSALFIIMQTRKRFNKMFGETEWVTAGGEAPYFYSYHQVFYNRIKGLTDEAMNLKHEIGGLTQASIVKNKLTGKKRKSGIIYPIYNDYGVDDVGSCVDFLKLTKHWKSDSGGISADDFSVKKSRDDLVMYLEKSKLQKDLQAIVGEVWKKIEDTIRLNRTRIF